MKIARKDFLSVKRARKNALFQRSEKEVVQVPPVERPKIAQNGASLPAGEPELSRFGLRDVAAQQLWKNRMTQESDFLETRERAEKFRLRNSHASRVWIQKSRVRL